MPEVRRVFASRLTIESTTLLAGCVLLALLAASLAAPMAAAAGAGADDDAFFKFMRPRLGYFSRYDASGPFSKIYEEYFANIIKKNDQAMESVSVDDWRKVRPTGELCVDFLIGLEVKAYVMSKPYEIIILDACLDWLLDDSDPVKVEEKTTDVERLDSSRKLSLKTLNADERLRQIRDNTRMSQESALPRELLDQIYAYLVRLLRIYSENPHNGCHSLWLEAYNDFIDDVYVQNCDDEANCNYFGIHDSQQRDDAYLNMMLESTKQASKSCYNVMQRQIRGLVESEFDRSQTGANSLKKRFLSKTSRVVRQSESEKWAREMISILQLASGVGQDSPINLGDVVSDLYKIKSGDKRLIGRFTEALNEYAKSNADLNESKNDQMGRARFGRAMIKLCRPYTDKKMFLAMTGGINMDDDDENKKPFEFYGLIYSLVRLTNHEQLFDITKDAFEDDIIKNRWEALYLATFACQIISTAWGELNYEQNTKSFDVRLRPEWSLMIADWPIELMNEKLPIMYPKSGAQATAAAKLGEAGASNKQPAAHFGKKFKLNLAATRQPSATASGPDVPEAAPTPAKVPVVPAPLPPVVVEPEAARPPPATPAPAPTRKPNLNPNPNPNIGTSHHGARPDSLVAHLPQRQEPKLMSWESIEMYRNLHGRYPQLPEFYRNIYPQLPDDLGAVYPKKVDQSSSKSSRGAGSGFGARSFGSGGGDFGGGFGNGFNNFGAVGGATLPARTSKKNDISSLSSLTF